MPGQSSPRSPRFEIVLLDIVFSLDSAISAVGMADGLPIMVLAVVIAIVVMLVAAGSASRFVNERPTWMMLALSFLLLAGVALVADALRYHIPREYLCFAIAFSVGAGALDPLATRGRKKKRPTATQPAK